MKNNFCVDTSRQEKKDFLKRVKTPLNIALFFTGIQTLAGFYYLIAGVVNSMWVEVGISNFVIGSAQYIAVICIFASLVKLLIDEKPFSNTLTLCMKVLAVLYVLEAVIFPRFDGYTTTFQLFSWGNKVLLDGNLLTIGVVLYVLSMIIQEGFHTQKEMEEII